MQFGRGQERDADLGGLRRLADAQVDNAGFKHFFERLGNMPALPTLISDHPSNGDRVALIARFSASRPTATISAKSWRSLRAICD
jgi:predicted Zn-dependent protease